MFTTEPFECRRVWQSRQESEVINRLDIENRKKALVLRPYPGRVYRLEDLVTRMTPRNMHKAIDFGGPVGREAP